MVRLTHERIREPGQPKTDGVGSQVYGANDAFDDDKVGGNFKLLDPPPEVAEPIKDFKLLDDQRSKDQGDGDDSSPPQGVLQKARRFCSEGHTAWDAFLSIATASVGQVILTYPYQLALMGIIPGIFIGLGVGILNFYTLWLLIVLYLQRKQDMVLAGTWYNAVDSNGYLRRQTVTQYHDIITFSLGKFLGVIGQFLTALYIFGVAIQQIVASAGSQYSIDKTYDKRQWALILGAPILVFGLLPSFRSVRLLNIIALVGTNYSCLYFLVTAAKHGRTPGIITRGPLSLQDFFLGAAVVGSAGHTIAMEMMDSMRRSRKFTTAAFLGWVWNIILLLPHSIAIVLAYPELILKQANVYAILPNTGWKYFSVYIMLIHNIGAFTLHTNPLLYMWEKIIRTHHLVWWIRIPSRLPVLAAIWVVSLAIPFYGTINSLFSALSLGITAFVLPTLAFNWHYRTEQRRKDCPVQPPCLPIDTKGALHTLKGAMYAISIHMPFNLYGWKPLFLFNIFLFCLFLGTSTGCGIFYSIKQLVNNIHTFHWFAACYQCTAPAPAAHPPAVHAAPAG